MVICFGDVLSNFIYIFYASPVHTEDVDDSDENCDPLWDSGALICLHVNKCRSDMTSFFYDQVHNLLPTAGQNIWNHRIFCSRFFVGACEPSYVRCQVGTNTPLIIQSTAKTNAGITGFFVSAERHDECGTLISIPRVLYQKPLSPHHK